MRWILPTFAKNTNSRRFPRSARCPRGENTPHAPLAPRAARRNPATTPPSRAEPVEALFGRGS
ncbi:hypothetical protein Taro_021557 [Colocasia esculenta]|uniref:Uncharacterized protein n=1 Tax=Colocasia esculenta TaxID=4460 RepID=A0A843V5Q3_COLES|nr:hypothetical protein [Colocasia esculenta]